MIGDLRAVLVGCGAISDVWFDGVARTPGVRLVGLVDAEPGRAAARAEEAALDTPTGTSLDRMIDATDCDVVFDCCPPSAREHVARIAFDRGCSVLAEKPMSLTATGAERVIQGAARAGVRYAVMQNHRFDPHAIRVHSILRSGLIGTITGVASHFAAPVRFGGFRASMGSSLLMDMAPHTFDLARKLIGREAVSVVCREWNPQGSWAAHGASASAIVEFEGGLFYTFHGSWCVSGLRTAWTSRWRFDGTDASLEWDGGHVIKIDPEFPLPEADRGPCLEPVGGHALVIRAFAEALRTGAAHETSGDDNIHSLRIVLAAVESASTGRPVTIAR